MEGAAVVAKNSSSPLAERLTEVRDRIAATATKAGRDAKDVTLIAVTKTAAPEQIREIVQLGVSDLGESRVQVIQQRIILRREQARRQAHRVQRRPEPVLAMGVIGPFQRRFAPRGRAAEHQIQAGTQSFGQDVLASHQHSSCFDGPSMRTRLISSP